MSTWGAFIAGAISVVVTEAVLERTHRDTNTRYGSRWHRMQHTAPWSIPRFISGGTSGRVAHVRVQIPDTDQTGKVFGHVCDTCGYVNVNSTLSVDALVEEYVCGRHADGFAWTTLDKVDSDKLEPARD